MQNVWILISHQRGKVVTKDEIKKNLRRAIMKTYNDIRTTLEQLETIVNGFVPSEGVAQTPRDTDMIDMNLFVQAHSDIVKLANPKDIARNASFFKADSVITAITVEQANELKAQYAGILDTYRNNMGISEKVVAHIYEHAVPGSHYTDMVSRHSHTPAMAA